MREKGELSRPDVCVCVCVCEIRHQGWKGGLTQGQGDDLTVGHPGEARQEGWKCLYKAPVLVGAKRFCLV